MTPPTSVACTSSVGRPSRLVALWPVLFVLLLGCGEEEPTPATRTVLAAESVRQSDGRAAVTAFLHCEDIDCEEALDDVVSVGRRAVPVLVELLESRDPGAASGTDPAVARTRLVIALGAIGDPLAEDALKAQTRAADPVLRAYAATALGRVGGEDALASLVVLLRDDAALVREMTAVALGRLGRRESLADLRAALSSEASPEVRAALRDAVRRLAG